MTDISAAISNLQSQWHTLPDLDRARTVHAIHQSGSLRSLAEALNCSPSLLSHLLTAMQAPPEDRFLARQGTISTNEVVRRARATGIRRTSMHREAREFERTQEALKGCRTICDWLRSECIQGPGGEQIVEQARRLLAIAEQTGQFSRDAATADMPTTTIIEMCRPAEPKADAISPVAWFGGWLARWVYYAMTDPRVRDNAIDLAFNEQFKR
jgi:AraC-like DNA-binding protein